MTSGVVVAEVAGRGAEDEAAAVATGAEVGAAAASGATAATATGAGGDRPSRKILARKDGTTTVTSAPVSGMAIRVAQAGGRIPAGGRLRDRRVTMVRELSSRKAIRHLPCRRQGYRDRPVLQGTDAYQYWGREVNF
ncbi:hypothetical protein AAVH_17662 [Aphelenchoides avenae]|nr:hypothetical protein AAVH_17662 [Aphelenchus avenae]